MTEEDRKVATRKLSERAAEYNKGVATRLNELLVKCRKTKADVARDIGKFQGSLTPWFTGEHAPHPEHS